MGFPQFLRSNGTPNDNAICIVAALQTCLRWNNQVVCQQIIDANANGSIVSWNFTESGIAPSWALLIADGDYYLLIDGTVNVDQWLTNISGAFATPLTNGINYVHGGFQEGWESIQSAVLAALPSDLSSINLNISGHSRGAAIAHIGANYFATVMPISNLSLINFGQPRTYSSGVQV